MRSAFPTIHARTVRFVIGFLIFSLFGVHSTPVLALQPVATEEEPVPQAPAAVTAAGDEFWSGRFVAPDLAGFILALAQRGDHLFVGGEFSQIGKRPIRAIAKWDGNAWSQLGGGLSSEFSEFASVNAIAIAGSKVFVGGEFGIAGSAQAANIAVWDETTRTWSALGEGVTSPGSTLLPPHVDALAVISDTLYVGGRFTRAGSLFTKNIARWSISQGKWMAMGGGVDDTVYAMTTNKETLYVGGRFDEANGGASQRLAAWDHKLTFWTQFPIGVDGDALNTEVKALALRGNELYVGGNFSVAGGKPAYNLARYDTQAQSWSTFGEIGKGTLDSVNALAISGNGNQLYVGGHFAQIGNIVAHNIARWNGTSWLPVGTSGNQGTDHAVYALLNNPALSDDLFVGGAFDYVNGQRESPNNIYAPSIAHLREQEWSALGLGLDCVPFTSCEPGIGNMTADDDYLYVTGIFNRAGGVKVNNIARFDGERWEGLNFSSIATASGMASMALMGTDLYVAGQFTMVNGDTFNGIAKYDTMTKQWSGLGTGADNGVHGAIHAMAVSGGKLYVGGVFDKAGGKDSLFAAVWDGATWQPLIGSIPPSNGLSSYVNAMTADGNGGVYMATRNCAHNGSGIAVGCGIVRFADGQWSGLKYGLIAPDFTVAPALSGGQIYIGGSFTQLVPMDNTLPVIPATNVARYDGSSWSTLGTPPNEGIVGERLVNTLAVDRGILYVGGCFKRAGGSNISHIASWNGGRWSSLGSGTDRCVNALLPRLDGLYVAGGFNVVGTTFANLISVWKRDFQRVNIFPSTPSRFTTPDNRFQLDLQPRSVTSRTVTLALQDESSVAPNAITDTLTLEVGPVVDPAVPLPAPFSPLRVYQVTLADANGEPIIDYSPPFSLTLRYTDEELVAWNLDEQSLNISRLDPEAGWQPLLPCAGCTHAPAQNEITIMHDRFAQFVLAGKIIEPEPEAIEPTRTFVPLVSPGTAP